MNSNSGRPIAVILWCLGIFLLSPPFANGFEGIRVNVEVIKASRKSTEVDSQLKELVKELAPVLNFSGFSLIKKTEIRLKPKAIEDVVLPSDRDLQLTFSGFEDTQARLTVRILEKGQESFRTTLLLVNEGSVLIGGPPHQDGVLLLRIGAVFLK